MNHDHKCQTVTNDNLDSDPYHTDFQSIIDSYITSVEHLPPGLKDRPIAMTTSSLITFNRDPAASEHLTDEIRWFLIQYGPHQPRDDEEQFLATSKSTQTQKGIVRFRAKWFDDVRFADWLEYSLTTSRAYCFYCRLFADSNRNRAFSRNGIRNWRKCLGSRGQKKRRATRTTFNAEPETTACQRRGLLESHALSESHKHAYHKYLAFIEQMHPAASHGDTQKLPGTVGALQNIK